MFNREVPQEVSDAIKELREFNHGKSADVLEKYINSLPLEFSREEWIEIFKRGALDGPETGWLSDLSHIDLEWNGREDSIMVGYEGSVDVGHIVGLILHVLEFGDPNEEI